MLIPAWVMGAWRSHPIRIMLLLSVRKVGLTRERRGIAILAFNSVVVLDVTSGYAHCPYCHALVSH